MLCRLSNKISEARQISTEFSPEQSRRLQTDVFLLALCNRPHWGERIERNVSLLNRFSSLGSAAV